MTTWLRLPAAPALRRSGAGADEAQRVISGVSHDPVDTSVEAHVTSSALGTAGATTARGRGGPR